MGCFSHIRSLDAFSGHLMIRCCSFYAVTWLFLADCCALLFSPRLQSVPPGSTALKFCIWIRCVVKVSSKSTDILGVPINCSQRGGRSSATLFADVVYALELSLNSTYRALHSLHGFVQIYVKMFLSANCAPLRRLSDRQ